MLLGFVTKGIPFFRTPKLASHQTWRSALAMVREEVVLLAGLWLAAAAVTIKLGVDAPDMMLWVIVLLVQSLSYLASVLVSFLSTMPTLRASYIGLRNIERPSIG